MMESRAKVLGHPAHPIMIVFPAGLLLTATIFDVIHLIDPSPEWGLVAYWSLVGGLIGGLAAAVPGWIDWFAIPSGSRAKVVGLAHGLGNVLALGIYGASWYLRLPDYAHPPALCAYLTIAGAVILGGTGWLGGELVNRLGVGVDPGANVNSPVSISGKPADAPRFS